LVVLNFHVRDICSKTQIWIVRYVCSISVYVANTYYFGMVSVNLVLDFCVLKISIFIIAVLLDLVWPTIWRCLLHWTELGLWKECNDRHEHIFCICQSNQSSTKVHLYENEYEPQDYLNFFCLGNRELSDNKNTSKNVKLAGQNTPQVFVFTP
jgi:hypothetical protein